MENGSKIGKTTAIDRSFAAALNRVAAGAFDATDQDIITRGTEMHGGMGGMVNLDSEIRPREEYPVTSAPMQAEVRPTEAVQEVTITGRTSVYPTENGKSRTKDDLPPVKRIPDIRASLASNPTGSGRFAHW